MGGLVCFQGGPAGRVRPLSRHRGAAGYADVRNHMATPKLTEAMGRTSPFGIPIVKFCSTADG